MKQHSRQSELANAVPALSMEAIEAAGELGWQKHMGRDGGFGASGPVPELYAHIGITAQALVAQAKRQIKHT